MALWTVGYPRGNVLDARNLCPNPDFETNLDYWTTSWYGPSTTGTFDRGSLYGWRGPNFARKKWSTSTNNVADAGFYSTSLPTTPGYTYRTSAMMACPNMGIPVFARAKWLNSAGGIITYSDGPIINMAANSWTKVPSGGVFTAPAGAASVQFGFVIGTAGMFAGNELWMDAVVFNSGPADDYYFDGDTTPNGAYTYSWDGTPHASTSSRLIPDPQTAVYPTLVMGYDRNTQSRNVVHDLLSGNVAAVIRSSSLRSGTLKLLFADPAAADVAERMHRGARYWQFADDAVPGEGMIYVVDGALRSYQSDSRRARVLEIPYREITP